MSPKHSWVSLKTTQREWLEDWGRRGEGYYVLESDDLTTILPPGLHSKINSAVLMIAPTSSGGTYVVVNNNRVDKPAWAIDQEPFGAIIDSTGARSIGLLLHHGDWPQRSSTSEPRKFWQHAEESGIAAYYPTRNLPSNTSGELSELSGMGHLEAFEEFKRRVRDSS